MANKEVMFQKPFKQKFYISLFAQNLFEINHNTVKQLTVIFTNPCAHTSPRALVNRIH